MRSTGAMKGEEARGGGGGGREGRDVMLHTDRSLLASHKITHMHTHTHACTHAHLIHKTVYT